jgi:hypothetical protein
MRPHASLRTLGWLALFAIAPGMAGPGAIVATLAAFASLGGEGAHHVSMQPDAGHDDFVFCHDARGDSDQATLAFAPSDCSDDHRLHAATAESLISRHDVSKCQQHAQLVHVAAPFVANVLVACDALPVLDAATFVANLQHRSVVLLL